MILEELLSDNISMLNAEEQLLILR